MSIFKKMGRALGFSGEDDEMESQPYTAENITNACVRERESQGEHAESAAPAEPSHNTEVPRSEESGEIQLPDTMLEVMVEMLNRSLPEYVVAALDKDAEKKYLFEQLDEPFKKFVADVNARSREWVVRKWENKHKALTKEVEEARVKVKELEEQRNAMQSAQLSAERQKRAVTDKVHELEARIATLEAEREQFDLENKSLVNKLKVSTVHQEEVDAAYAEVAQLREELKKQTGNSAEAEQLRNDLQQAQVDLAEAREKEQEATVQLEKAREELARQEEKMAQLVKQIETLEADLAEAREKEQEAKAQLETVRKELARQDEMIAQQTKQIEVLEADLTEARNGLKVVDEVEAKLKQFEQVKASKDDRIAQLSKTVQELGEANARLQTRLGEMAQRNERLESRAQEAATRQSELDTLKADLESANALVAALRNQRQELLSQMEALQAAKLLEEKPVPTVDVPPVVEKPEPTVISFDTPQSDEPEVEPVPVVEPVSEQPAESVPELSLETAPQSDIPVQPEQPEAPRQESEPEPEEEPAQPVEKPKPARKSRRKPKAPEKVEVDSVDDDFPGLDSFGDNWLIPTRPDTPEMIAKRKEEEKKRREAEEQAAMEQKKSHQVDPSQMTLW